MNFSLWLKEIICARVHPWKGVGPSWWQGIEMQQFEDPPLTLRCVTTWQFHLIESSPYNSYIGGKGAQRQKSFQEEAPNNIFTFHIREQVILFEGKNIEGELSFSSLVKEANCHGSPSSSCFLSYLIWFTWVSCPIRGHAWWMRAVRSDPLAFLRVIISQDRQPGWNGNNRPVGAVSEGIVT